MWVHGPVRCGEPTGSDRIATRLGAVQEFDEIRALLRDGKKIQAIRVYRDRTGAGLKEAKDAVERLAGEG